MKATVAAAIILAIGASLSAKGVTTRITITGGDLATSLDIADEAAVQPFQVWAGPGTQSCIRRVCREGTEGFIVDWPAGAATERPSGLPRYTVSFYTAVTEGMIDSRGTQATHPPYVVLYEYDAATRHGYVYLPSGARGDEWGATNTAAIFRGVEGRWLHASSAWTALAAPLIAQRRP
jgi:hypothetical protein